MDDLMTITDAAKQLGITRQGLDQAIRAGRAQCRNIGRWRAMTRAQIAAFRKLRETAACRGATPAAEQGQEAQR